MKIDDTTLATFRRALRQLEAGIGQNLSDETSCCGVTVAQCHLLLETGLCGNASLGELSQRLATDKSALSRTVESLVQAGYVTREENSENRRKVSISLTPAGDEKVRYINRLCNESYADVFSRIPEDKHQMIVESVMILAGAMRDAKKSRKEETCC
jgi:DNA-binding MarR family transcriptional regulator